MNTPTKPMLRVIKGSGQRPPPRDVLASVIQNYFRQIIIDELRMLARGSDTGGRVQIFLEEFVDLASQLKQPPVSNVVAEVNADLARFVTFDDDYRTPQEELMDDVVVSVLRLVAERFCRDDAAQAREAKAEGRLEAAIKKYAAYIDSKPNGPREAV